MHELSRNILQPYTVRIASGSDMDALLVASSVSRSNLSFMLLGDTTE